MFRASGYRVLWFHLVFQGVRVSLKGFSCALSSLVEGSGFDAWGLDDR